MQTDVASDPKITKLIRLGGVDAWTVFTWVLILTYREGYYSKIEPVIENIAFMFRDISDDRIRECLQMLVDSELLDADLFSKGILSSHGIQRQYSTITSRRKEFPDVKYWLHKDELNSINVNNNQVELDKCMQKRALNSEYVGKSTQTETETERETEIEIETETDGSLLESDFLIPDFYGCVMANLKDIGVEIRKNTENIVSRWVRDYDQRSIIEAIEIAANRKARNIVGYADSILRKWEIGDGSPKWLENEELAYAEQKKEYMKAGAFDAKGVLV